MDIIVCRKTQNGTLWIRRPKTPPVNSQSKQENNTPIINNIKSIVWIWFLGIEEPKQRSVKRKKNEEISNSETQLNRIEEISTLTPNRIKIPPIFASKCKFKNSFIFELIS